MARLSRVTGPTANFELTAAWQNVPQLSVTREFGNGPILIMIQLAITNNAGATVALHVGLALDGTLLTVPYGKRHILNTLGETLNLIHAIPPIPGIHTLSVQALGHPAAGDIVRNMENVFTVYEIPLVDQPALIA